MVLNWHGFYQNIRIRLIFLDNCRELRHRSQNFALIWATLGYLVKVAEHANTAYFSQAG